MKTQYLRAGEPGALELAAALLREGELVVFPTDTVYGVGALAHDAAAIARLFEAKERSLQKGIPILLAEVEALGQVVRETPAVAQFLIGRYWPGPLTLVLPRQPTLPDNLAPDDRVAVRVPDSAVARDLIRRAGGAVATTSANLSGAPPARTAEEALAALGGRVAAVLDGGAAPGGVASTVVDCTVDPPAVLREGPILPELIPFMSKDWTHP